MAAKKSATQHEKVIEVKRLDRKLATFYAVGVTELVLNRMSEKAKRELLLPSIKNRASRTANLKHNPREEFLAAAHRLLRDDSAKTYLAIPSVAVKMCGASAALDVPGDASKAKIGRLTYVIGNHVGVYGMPKLHMGIVRMADINRTPDVRTRVIIPEWAMTFTVNYASPMLNETSVANLWDAGGMICGIGDGRVEKGKLSFGQFRLCSPKDPEYVRITKAGGRKAQIAAMERMEPFDEEAEELLGWYDTEVAQRNAAKQNVPAQSEVASVQ